MVYYLKNGKKYTERQVRHKLDNLSFPSGANLSEYGYTKVEATPRPKIRPGTYLEEGPVQEYKPGHWRQTWNVVTIPVAEQKQRFQIRRKQVLKSHQDSGFLFRNKIVQSDSESRMLITGIVAQAQYTLIADTQKSRNDFDLMIGRGWLAADDTIIAKSPGDVIEMGKALGGHISKCHLASQIIKHKIEAAKSHSELEKIDLHEGYPDLTKKTETSFSSEDSPVE